MVIDMCNNPLIESFLRSNKLSPAGVKKLAEDLLNIRKQTRANFDIVDG